jgi:carboxymethylenebutenolidase
LHRHAASMIDIPVGHTSTKAYLSVPEGGDVPGVLVIHAWWGLTDFFRSVCNRLADTGFVALAPDLYMGKTASTIGEAKRLRSKLTRTKITKVLNCSVDHLLSLFAETGQRIGVLGFSLGAYWALWLAESKPREVAAVVPFYGTRSGSYKKTRAAFLGHFAENDEWAALKSVHKLEERIRLAGKEVTFFIYPGTKHWFFEENQPNAYDEAAAKLAWGRTVKFLHRQLN